MEGETLVQVCSILWEIRLTKLKALKPFREVDSYLQIRFHKEAQYVKHKSGVVLLKAEARGSSLQSFSPTLPPQREPQEVHQSSFWEIALNICNRKYVTQHQPSTPSLFNFWENI